MSGVLFKLSALINAWSSGSTGSEWWEDELFTDGILQTARWLHFISPQTVHRPETVQRWTQHRHLSVAASTGGRFSHTPAFTRFLKLGTTFPSKSLGNVFILSLTAVSAQHQAAVTFWFSSFTLDPKSLDCRNLSLSAVSSVLVPESCRQAVWSL